MTDYEGSAFPHLDAATRKRHAERGIDIEASYRSLLFDVAVAPPTRLLEDIANAPGISVRELEILERAAAGETNKEIAQALGLGLETIKRGMEHICIRLSACNRTHAVACAIRVGLIR